MRKIILSIMALLLVAGCAGTSDSQANDTATPQQTPTAEQQSEAPQETANPTGEQSTPSTNLEEEVQVIPELNEPMRAIIEMENGGKIELELYLDIAPQSVLNFVSLARKGYYDGLKFHRVIEGFMIQGGDPKGDGSGGPGYNIKGEYAKNNFDNPLKHERGVISMARQGDPFYDSAGSQFFIMHQDYPSLNGSYAAFGKVINGMEVVDEIATCEKVGERPKEDIIIKSITIEGPELPEPNKLNQK